MEFLLEQRDERVYQNRWTFLIQMADTDPPGPLIAEKSEVLAC
jgi:hypothetical protein